MLLFFIDLYFISLYDTWKQINIIMTFIGSGFLGTCERHSPSDDVGDAAGDDEYDDDDNDDDDDEEEDEEEDEAR